MTHNISKVFL